MQETPAVPEALGLMIEAYTLLGQQDLAADTQAVLNQNFPNYTYQPTYTGEKSLFDAATFDLFSSDKKASQVKPVSLNTQEEKPQRSLLNKVTFGLFGDDGKEDK